MKKILVVFGTRPEAIKMAPVVKILGQAAEFAAVTAVTAQHRQMLDQVLELFAIKPDYDLDIMQPGQTLTEITTRALLGLQTVLERENPDLVLVHGDTTTTLAGSLAAYYRQIPVGHVEAGLRTFNKYAPFPEELNRKLTGALTDLHFAPTATAKGNLLREAVPPGAIVVTGNTVIDALLRTVKPQYRFGDALLDGLDFTGHRVILITAHRRENLGEPLRRIFNAIKALVAANPETEAIFPVHLNPKVQELARAILGGRERIHLIEPLDYEPFANLLNRSYLVLTDSGGVQEEAPALGKPVLVLRDTTERPEAIAAGTVKMVGTDPEKLFNETNILLRDRQAYLQMANAVNPYGDGQAAARILQALRVFFGLSQEPVAEFFRHEV
ncbi:MAG: UDP-N-acetylglucosamine 2-epimerase (non-hydrolyzing) [Bacillota bacterium]